MLKLSNNPPMCPPDANSLAELPGRWWVAHTRSRFEKSFAWDLLRRGIGYFLPMTQRTRLSGGRKRRVMRPLFASYVFFCGDEASRHAAMTTGRLCRTLDVPDQASFVAELAAVEQALTGGAALAPYPFAAVGRRCRIDAGPLRGLEGTVVEHRGSARLVLEVSVLGQGVSVEIDADLLAPAD